VAIGLCVLAMPLGLLHGAICVASSLGALVLGIWLAIHVALSPWHREYRRRRTARNHAWNDLAGIEEEWRQTVLHYRRSHSQSSRPLQNLVSQCRGLASQYQAEVQQLAASAEAKARIRHLVLHQIADAAIPKIGVGRIEMLRSNGIVTAADIDEHRIRRIKGFGDVLTGNLLAWKGEVLRQFRFDPATGISPAEQRVVSVKFRNAQQQFLFELSKQLSNLESLAPACRAALQKLTPNLQRAVAAYQHSEGSLRSLNGNGRGKWMRWIRG
jgi:DNA-binding helix-hairpin-helix protein with protein kinase domain